MPFHIFLCDNCGEKLEKMVMHEERQTQCSCGGQAQKKLTAPGFRIGRKLKWIDK